jgi:hypothetical protein
MAPGQAHRVFTLEAVNALIPQLRPIVSRQIALRVEIEAKLKELSRLTGEVPDEVTPPSPSDPEPVRTLKGELLARISEYQQGWHEVEGLGAVLKDPKIGLLDFYGRVEGRLVWLCWKYGEDEVTHYHGLDEGFAARKTIGHSLKVRLLN